MGLSYLRYARQVLGIREWSWLNAEAAPFSKSQSASPKGIILCEDAEHPELVAMLDKIRQALKWHDCEVRWSVAPGAYADELTDFSGKQIRFSSAATPQAGPRQVVTHSLSRLQREPGLKREVWERLKSLLELG